MGSFKVREDIKFCRRRLNYIRSEETREEFGNKIDSIESLLDARTEQIDVLYTKINRINNDISSSIYKEEWDAMSDDERASRTKLQNRMRAILGINNVEDIFKL